MLDIVMPKAGIDMQEGKVIKWLKKEGDAIKKGEVIAEIETDKVTIEEESPMDGVVLQLLAEEGETIPVTEVIAWVGKEGEVPPAKEEKKEAAPVAETAAPQEVASDVPMVPAPIKGLVDIVMPKAGIDMQEGKVVRWVKNEGDPIKKGDVIAEIETDKVTIEEESPIDGVFLKKMAEEGVAIPVVQIIAYVGKEGSKMPAEIPMVPDPNAKAAAPAAKPEKKAPAKAEAPKAAKKVTRAAGEFVLATPYARLLASENGVDIATVAGSGENGVVKAADVMEAKANATGVAKAVAASKGIDLAAIAGSGFGGKILSRDVLASITGAPVKATREEKRLPMNGMRKVIAKRMTQSHQEIPVVTNTIPVDVTDLMELRRQINEMEGIKVSVNDFVLRAVASALVECPEINVTLDGDVIVFNPHINVGMAVGTDDALVVPVIRDADDMHLFEISQKAKDFGKRGKANKLGLDELSGGTFTVSNIGMFGITNFTPIINQPEAAILGVCAIEDVLKRVNGEIVDRKMMNLCLTYDHRMIDGVKASKFLNVLKSYMECPAKLLF